MKDFFKQVAATFVGLLIFSIISSIFIFIGLIGMSLSGSQSNTIKNNSVLVLNLSGSMNERVEDDFQAKITGQMTGQIGLDNLISGIRKAKNNDNIKGIYMEFGAFTADSYASMQAARNALEDFKKSGKWIVPTATSTPKATTIWHRWQIRFILIHKDKSTGEEYPHNASS